MIIEFEGYRVTVENPKIQEQIKSFLLGKRSPLKKRRSITSLHQWTRDEKEGIVAMAIQGLSIKQIAERMALRYSVVSSMYYALARSGRFIRTSSKPAVQEITL